MLIKNLQNNLIDFNLNFSFIIITDTLIFLDIDDDNLYNFYKGSKTDFLFDENNINLLFKNFKYKAKE